MDDEKALWLTDSEVYLDIFINSEDDFEYTLYDYRLDELDGGIVTDLLSGSEALRLIAEMHGLSLSNVYELDFDTFATLVENKRGMR